MKKTIGLFGIFVLSAGMALAGEMPEGWAPPKISPELERIKSFAGKWTGESVENNGEPKPVTITYALTSGGSAVIETIDPGTSHEMTSIYHDKSGKLSMEHYCMLGNQPSLELKNSSEGKLDLDLSADGQALLGKEMHMHSLTIENAGDAITETWTAHSADGQPQGPMVIKLHR